jgi:hypothetical protein
MNFFRSIVSWRYFYNILILRQAQDERKCEVQGEWICGVQDERCSRDTYDL